MKIFIAGGSGVLGQALVPKLIRDGHDVIATTRSEAKLENLKAMGARPVLCNVLDKETLIKAMIDAAPNVVLHQVTAFSSSGDPFGETNRLRTEGTANLIEAAREAKSVKHVVAQSVAFLCDPNDDRASLTNEQTPLYVKNAPSAFEAVVGALESLEKQVLALNKEDEKMIGTVLRYGHFYGPGTFYGPEGFVTTLVRNGQFPIVAGNDGDHARGTYSFISTDDAAIATVQAVAKAEKTGSSTTSGICAIVDDTPVASSDWVSKYSEILEAPPPAKLSAACAKDKLDPFTYFFLTGQKGASNKMGKDELDWSPRTPQWSTGFEASLAGVGSKTAST